MIDRRVEDAGNRILDPEYRWETICEWLRRNFQVETEPHSLKGMSLDQLMVFLKETTFTQSEVELGEN
ncbi:MAG: hypothetical protein R3C11_25855 [Planctomycetaceae bacterium]